MKRVHTSASEQLKKHDLTFSQYKALMLLRYSEDLSMSAVKKELFISQSGATILIDKLVKKGVIRRYYSSKDRRRVMITSTKKGRDVLEKLCTGHEEYIENMSEKMGKENLKLVTKTLKILLEFLDASSD